MTQKDEQQLSQLLATCRGIFLPFDLIEIHRLMDCVVDAYEKVEEGLTTFVEKYSQKYDDEERSFYIGTLYTYKTVMDDKRNLLRKLNDIQNDMTTEPRLLHRTTKIRHILDEEFDIDKYLNN